MFNIDPRIGVYLNGALLFVMAVGSGTIGLPPGVSPDLAHLVVAWAGWISVVANFFLHGVSSGNSGPFNQAPAPGRASSSLVVGILALGVAARLAGAPLAMLAAWATYGLLLALVACLLVDLWRLAAHMRRRSIGIVRSPALAVILATAIAAAPSQCSPTADLSAMARTIDAIVVKGQAIDAATMQAIKTNLPGAAKVAIQLDSYAQSLNSLGVLQPAVVAATNLATHNDP